jgi:hypothetical protein
VKIKITCIKYYFLGWMICELDDMGLADGAANFPIVIGMEKFGMANNQLSLVLLGRINSCEP